MLKPKKTAPQNPPAPPDPNSIRIETLQCSDTLKLVCRLMRMQTLQHLLDALIAHDGDMAKFVDHSRANVHPFDGITDEVETLLFQQEATKAFMQENYAAEDVTPPVVTNQNGATAPSPVTNRITLRRIGNAAQLAWKKLGDVEVVRL